MPRTAARPVPSISMGFGAWPKMERRRGAGTGSDLFSVMVQGSSRFISTHSGISSASVICSSERSDGDFTPRSTWEI